ncbi:MAG TPA: lipopolysaccharide kinase InaA family protein, partial [Gemmataceae bacterium]|nr:lipopolysaccharide kinase InaA family protein [Gemmataceae bacterium]
GQPRRRRRFALRLGTALAQFHNAGFEHRDLYSKHIAVDENGAAIHFLDLQRARRRQSVSWAHRWRDLAALEATVGDDVLPQTDRLTCLRAYLRRCRLDGVSACPTALRAAFQVLRAATPLLAKRRIQESRQAPPAHVIQRLLWLDGEALCVTPEFNRLLQGSLPDWLILEKMPGQGEQILLDQNITLSNGQLARLVRRRELRFVGRLWNGMRGRRVASSALRQSGILFRLERVGLRVPRLMAFGQRYVGARTVESMLLTEAMDGSSLAAWGERTGGAQTCDRATLAQRRLLIQQAGLCLQRLHHARCYFARRSPCKFVVDLEAAAPARPRIALAAVDHIITVPRQNRRLQEANLLALRNELGKLLQSRTDHLRLICSYLGIHGLNARARRLLDALLRVHGRPSAAVPRCSRPIRWAISPLAGRSAS